MPVIEIGMGGAECLKPGLLAIYAPAKFNDSDTKKIVDGILYGL